ncbi:MAG: polysaccharide biosynthesis C-terminal domain-containing protein, partial [Nitrososphaerales archaeon]
SDQGMRHLVKFSSFNYFSVGMRTLSAQIGVILLGTQNFEWAAFYGLSVLIANVIGGILVAVSRAVLPTAAEEWAKGKKIQFMRVFNTTVRLSLFISGYAFLVFMIDPSYALGLLSKSYTEASSALRILVISSTINAISVIIISLLNAANRADSVAKIGLLSSSGIVALTFLLAPVIGIEGAAVAMLVGSVCSLVLSLMMLRMKEQLTISVNSIAKPAISICVGLIVGYLLLTIVHSTPIAIIVAIVSYAGFSVMYGCTSKSELETLLGMVLHTTKTLRK